MRSLAILVLGAIELGGAFGSASATVESIDDRSMVVEISVEVRVSAQAVVAHLSFDEEASVPTPLLDRGGGTFGIRTELEPKNHVVVFEVIGEEGALSEPRTLTQLGAVLSDFEPGGPPAGEGLSPETIQFGWLALALAAASLSALAFWALGDRRASDEGPGAADEEV